MVWGCFTKHGVGPLVRIEGIMKKEMYLSILQENLPAAFDKIGLPENQIIFQHDGDPKHTAKIVVNWLQNQRFEVLKWPAQSPDMNPIENLWGFIKKRLANYAEPPVGVNQLWERVKEEWNSIPQEIIDNLYSSMPRRMQELQKNKGLWTKY